MIATPLPAPDGDSRLLARALLDTAAQLDADERDIKDAILAAARANDTAKVVSIITRWQHMPASEVLVRGLE